MARDEFLIIWMDEAKNDFEAGLILKDSKKYNIAVFHFQQAAEKAAKGLHYFHDRQPLGSFYYDFTPRVN